MLVGKEIGPFRIEKELGSGAMGTVYRAVYRETGQRVAVKFIAFGLLGNETAVKRFEREAGILKQLRHPNIVRLVGHGHYKKTPFIAMEYVEGESLDRILSRRGPFPWDEVVAMGRQLCDALQHAHEKGIIHRDIKPSNVMVLKGGTVKLTDFGIAKDVDVTALTGANSTVGTAAYMSPEQCKGERNLSAKSDLYSMGVVFYELLTGRKPFVADSPIEMFQAHVSGTFERPSRRVLDIPVWLDNLVCNLLEKKPEHRPFDAAMVDKVLSEVEEKVAAQRSAGVDMATARKIDRGSLRPADETDREAARTLRGAVLKKKVRKKSVPLARRKWVQATALLAALAALGGVVVWLTRPPTPEKLYARVKAAVESKDTAAALKDIDRYLALYGSRGDEPTRQVQGWNRTLRVDQREYQLHNRFNSKLGFKPEDDGQKLAYDALTFENEGELDDAARKWREMEVKFKDDPDPEAAVYGWLAQKKLAELAKLQERERWLLDELDRQHAIRPPDRKEEPGEVERACLEAMRAQTFGDLPAARDRWEKVREQHLKDLDARGWVVLAAANACQLKGLAVSGKEKEKEFRLELVRAKMARANAVRPDAGPTDKRLAVSIYRDVIALYGNDPDAQVSTFAREAKDRLPALERV
jgi:serine/threonine-protein kinase